MPSAAIPIGRRCQWSSSATPPRKPTPASAAATPSVCCSFRSLSPALKSRVRLTSSSPPSAAFVMWSLDDWHYVERRVVSDPKGRQWTIALMDVLGQKGDPDMPSDMLQLQYASGRYFTLIYAHGGALQWERGC